MCIEGKMYATIVRIIKIQHYLHRMQIYATLAKKYDRRGRNIQHRNILRQCTKEKYCDFRKFLLQLKFLMYIIIDDICKYIYCEFYTLKL